MPLSEFYTMAKGKVESTQHKTTTCSNDLSYGPDNEFVELVWENGQLMMQGQSSRVRKSPIFNTSPSQTPKLREREIGSSTNSKMVKFGAMGSVSDDFPIPVASGEMGLGQDDELVPWLNYPIDDTLENDYCSELLPELSGVTVNELTVQNSFTSSDKKNSFNQTIKGSHNVSINGVGLEQGNGSKVSSSGGDELSKSRSTQLYPWSSQHGQTSVPSIHSGVSGISSNNTRNTHHVVCGSSSQGQASETGFPIMKMQKKDSGLPNASSGFLNFSQYLRPAGLVTANLQNLGPISTPGSSGTESYMVPAKLDSQPLVAKPLDESRPAGQSDAVCEENAVKDNESMDQAPDGSPTKEMEDVEKTVEPIVASSSVCSGNSAERASNGRARNLKRKFHEADDSEYRSEDIEEESVGVRKAAPARGGTSSKRSRAAEVHNLSERRRRDRINEKMRALQELIPNCNKVDKASMLDEAIEYLKTLQLQVQIMSMGAGLYMPPMMLPAGMQHIHAGHMGHFSPMGVGMGMRMGMGYDMGMIQVPPMHGAHFSAPHISGPNSFHGMAGSNLPVFGLPGQGLPMSMPRPPLGPYSGGPPMTSAVGPNTSSSLAVPAKVPISASMSSSKDLIENANSHMVHDANANNSMNQTSSQCHARNKGFEQSPLVSKHDQSQNISCNEAVHLTNASEIAPNTLVDQPVVSDIQD